MTLSLSVQLLNKMFKLQSTRNRNTSPRRSNSSNDSNSLNFESKNTASKVDVQKVTGQVWLKIVKVIQKAGGKSRLDVSMELIRDKRYEIRDTRWRFNFVNSINQFIYFTQVHYISITQSQFQLRSRQALFPAGRRCLALSRCTWQRSTWCGHLQATSETRQVESMSAPLVYLYLNLVCSLPVLILSKTTPAASSM